MVYNQSDIANSSDLILDLGKSSQRENNLFSGNHSRNNTGIRMSSLIGDKHPDSSTHVSLSSAGGIGRQDSLTRRMNIAGQSLLKARRTMR
jgi:hypothetical protein